MPRTPSAPEVAERIYARKGGKATADETVAAVKSVLEQLERATASVVGEVGFQAIFARCLRRAKETYPSLRGMEPGERGALFDPLVSHLSQQDEPTAIAVGTLLLTSFFELLATLIGDDLTFRLFRDAWPEALAGALDSVEKS
jgi:hypothetical protein